MEFYKMFKEPTGRQRKQNKQKTENKEKNLFKMADKP